MTEPEDEYATAEEPLVVDAADSDYLEFSQNEDGTSFEDMADGD